MIFNFTHEHLSLQEFKDAQSSSLDISVNAEAGWAGYGGKFGYKQSGSAKKAKEFFESGESVMMISTADCLLYQLRINRFLLPGDDDFRLLYACTE